MIKLEHFIQIEPNILSIDICDALLAEYSASQEWVSAKTVGGLDLQTRNCDTIKMSMPDSIGINQEKRLELDNKILKSLSWAAKSYFWKFPRSICNQDTGYELLRYKEGGFFKEHVDYSPNTNQRQLSFSFALNDDYEGGEFQFFGNSQLYRVPKGSCIIFPSNFVFPHQIMPITSGTRYSIVTWMH
jgi:predicted 2-oxoglutarate/Fe(II)-dependent dioxygenase YbiX